MFAGDDSVTCRVEYRLNTHIPLTFIHPCIASFPLETVALRSEAFTLCRSPWFVYCGAANISLCLFKYSLNRVKSLLWRQGGSGNPWPASRIRPQWPWRSARKRILRPGDPCPSSVHRDTRTTSTLLLLSLVGLLSIQFIMNCTICAEIKDPVYIGGLCGMFASILPQLKVQGLNEYLYQMLYFFASLDFKYILQFVKFILDSVSSFYNQTYGSSVYKYSNVF